MNRNLGIKKFFVVILAVLVILSGSYVGYRIVSEQIRRSQLIAALRQKKAMTRVLMNDIFPIMRNTVMFPPPNCSLW